MQPLPPHEMNDAAELPLAAARACPLLLVKPCLPSLYCLLRDGRRAVGT